MVYINIAIISGASKGIGKAMAKELDKEGLDQLWFVCRSYKNNDEYTTPIRHFSLDLSSSGFTEEIKSALSKGDYNIKFLVCSAGVGYMGNLDELSEDGIVKIIDINCSALTLLTKICLPYMDRGSKIIEIASGAGFLPQPHFSVYASSKSYVVSLSRALRQELKPRKINVTAVCPGPVDTQFFSALNPPEYKKKYLISPEMVAKKALKSAKRGKAICSPSFSIKMVHLASKLIPTSLIMKFWK